MKKEYIRPEAEMMKFVGTEEIMVNSDPFAALMSTGEMPTDYDWSL